MDTQLRDKDFKFTAWSHACSIDKKGNWYCRALNTIQSPKEIYCEFCPLWIGDGRDKHCLYYDFLLQQNDYPPKKMKSYIDGLIKAGFTEEFPDFVTPNQFQNFGGIINPPDWSLEEWIFVEKAYQFAAKAHKGVKRKDGKTPYFTHPMETAFIAFQMSSNPNVIAAAVLHDVVEDTSFTIADIEFEFGSEVSELVGYESEDKRPDIKPEYSWKIRKEEFLNHLAHAPREAKIITLADKMSNIKSIERDLEKMGDKVWERFNQKDKKEHAWYYYEVARLTSELSNFDIWKEYKNICIKIFSDMIE